VARCSEVNKLIKLFQFKQKKKKGKEEIFVKDCQQNSDERECINGIN